MNEVPQHPGYLPEPNKLDPELTQAGVHDLDQEHAKHLEEINNHLADANTTVGEKTPVVEPHPDSVLQVEQPHKKQSPQPIKKPDVVTHAGVEAFWGTIKNFFSAFKNPSRFWKSANSVTNTISVADINKIRGEEPFPEKMPDTGIPLPGLNQVEASVDTSNQGLELPDNIVPFPGTTPQTAPTAIPQGEEELPHAA